MKVLIIDDNQTTRILMKSHIERMNPTAEVIFAKTGGESFSIIRENDVDVITLDYDLPDMKGLAVAPLLIEYFEKRKLEGAIAEIPKIFMLTSNKSIKLQQKIQEMGIIFLDKPLTPSNRKTFREFRKVIAYQENEI